MSEELVTYETQNTAMLARNKIYAGIPDDDVKLALAICNKYRLDPLLRHVVLIKGRGKDRKGDWIDVYNIYITRDGLLHIGHESGVPFWIIWDEPVSKKNPYSKEEDIYLSGTLFKNGQPTWKAGLWFLEYVQVGKDGKAIGFWATHPAAAHQKVVEVYLYRRGFDVSLPAFEEVQRVISEADVVDIEKIDEIPYHSHEEPAPANGRPYNADQLLAKLRQFSQAYAERDGDKEAATDTKNRIAGALNKLFSGDEQKRYTFTRTTLGFTSTRDMKACHANALNKWMGLGEAGGFEAKCEYCQDEANRLVNAQIQQQAVGELFDLSQEQRESEEATNETI